MGMMTPEGEPSVKLQEAALFMELNKLDILAIMEAVIHGRNSRVNRRNSFRTARIHELLEISGYKIILPDS